MPASGPPAISRQRDRPPVGFSMYREVTVFGIAAVVLFLLSYVLNGFNVGNQWVGPHPLAYLGLACLALHVLGVSAGIPWRRAS